MNQAETQARLGCDRFDSGWRRSLCFWRSLQNFTKRCETTSEAKSISSWAEAPLPGESCERWKVEIENGKEKLVRWEKSKPYPLKDERGNPAQIPMNAVISMGRRNISPKSMCRSFKGLRSFANVDSKETPPCSGLIEDSLRDRFFVKTVMESTD